MKNKLQSVLVVLVCVCLTLAVWCILPDTQTKTYAEDASLSTGASDSAVDYSVPVKGSSNKQYKSNIPDAWYSSSLYYGVSKNYYQESVVAGIDFISLDGKTNYANLDSVALEVGETLEFYLEVGAENYGASLLTSGIQYSIYSNTNVFDLNISINYGGVEHELYDSQNSARFVNDWSGDLELADNPYSLYYNPATSSYDYENIAVNSDYRLMKFTITAKELGASVLDVGFSPYDLAFEKSKKLVINVTDGEKGLLKDTYAIISSTDNLFGADRLAYYFTGDIKDKTLPLPVSKKFSFSTSDYTFLIADEEYSEGFSNVEYRFSLASSDVNLSIDEDVFGNFYLTAKASTLSQIQATTQILVYYETESSEQSAFITKTFSFNVLALDESSLKLENSLGNEDGSYIYPTGYELDFNSAELSENEYLQVTTTIDGISEFIFNDTGSYQGQVLVKNILLEGYYNNLIDSYIDELCYEYEYGLSEAGEYSVEEIAELVQSYRAQQNEQIKDVFLLDYPSSIESDFSITIKDEDEVFVSPKLMLGESVVFGEINVDISQVSQVATLSLSSATKVLSINDYDTLSQIATINFSSLQEGIHYSNGDIYLDNVNEVARYDVKLTASFAPYTQKTSSFVINLVDQNLKVGLDATSKEVYVDQIAHANVNVLSGDSSIDINNIKLELLTKNKLVEVSQNQNNPSQIDILPIKEGLDSVVIIVKHSDLIIDVLSLNILVLSEQIIEDKRIDFVQGNDIRIYLSNNSNQIDLTIDSTLGLDVDFTWICLNESVLDIEVTSPSNARVTAKKQGSTTIIAFAQLSDGSSVNAVASITVLAEKPTVDVVFKKKTDTAFTVYDLIEFSIDTHGFILSNDISVKWSVNDKVISQALNSEGLTVNLKADTLSFFNKLEEGIHNVKIEITDNKYDIVLVGEKQIAISTIADQKRELSFTKNQVNLVCTNTNQDIYNINVLVDGIKSDEFEYKWSVDNREVVEIMSNGATLQIKPLCAGDAVVTVFCDVGVMAQNIIIAELKVHVEALESISLVLSNAFPKPEQDLTVELYINGKGGFDNVNTSFSLTSLGESTEHYFVGAKATIEKLSSGSYEISASFNGQSAVMSINVTNFNIKEFMQKVLPYLLIAVLVLVVLFIVIRQKTHPFKSVVSALNKFENILDNSIKITQQSNDVVVVKQQYKKLIKSSTKLISRFNYYYDDGQDQFKSPLLVSAKLKDIIVALYKTAEQKTDKANEYLTKIKEKQFAEIKNMLDEAILSVKKYNQALRESDKKDILEQKQMRANKKAEKKEKNELAFLKQQGIFPDDDDE